jgi:hypothetical protein
MLANDVRLIEPMLPIASISQIKLLTYQFLVVLIRSANNLELFFERIIFLIYGRQLLFELVVSFIGVGV